MKPDFALDDSLTFNSVLPWSHFNTAGGRGNRDAASSKLLQEKVTECVLTLFRQETVLVRWDCFWEFSLLSRLFFLRHSFLLPLVLPFVSVSFPSPFPAHSPPPTHPVSFGVGFEPRASSTIGQLLYHWPHLQPIGFILLPVIVTVTLIVTDRLVSSILTW